MHVYLGSRIWAVDKKETKKPQEEPVVEEEANEFVDYKDRNKALAKKERTKMDVDLGLENAASGLIIRKRKQVKETHKVKPGNTDLVESSSAGVDIVAEDKKAKKVLGLERPSFLDGETDYESWVLPQGHLQSERGALNVQKEGQESPGETGHHHHRPKEGNAAHHLRM
ncbi:hypothetical protein Tco_0457933 [Tanacetum coccineum]